MVQVSGEVALRAPGWRRVAAWTVDWLIISLYAVALIPLGLVLSRTVSMPVLGWNALAFVLLIVVVTSWLAWWEHVRGATPGKRALGLRVEAAPGERPGFGRALARNALKVALPWEIGHTGAYLAYSSPGTGTAATVAIACCVLACLLALWYVLSLFIGPGRPPYDLVAGTDVCR